MRQFLTEHQSKFGGRRGHCRNIPVTLKPLDERYRLFSSAIVEFGRYRPKVFVNPTRYVGHVPLCHSYFFPDKFDYSAREIKMPPPFGNLS